MNDKIKINTTMDYFTVNKLKEIAKKNKTTLSFEIGNIIEKHFFEEKTETKLNEIDKKIDLSKEEILSYFKSAMNIIYSKLHYEIEEVNKKIK